MGKFRIILPIPEEFRGYANYTIIHVHAGEVSTLADLDDNPDTITIEVDKFSTFVLLADENAVVEEVEDDPVIETPEEKPEENQPEIELEQSEKPEEKPEEPEEKLNLFQRIWRAICNFFKKLFGKKNK